MATLYRTYRPQTFGELVGQDHIRRTLQAALAQNRVAHAYLFAGPRGVGKTSVARLLAKTVNCLSATPDQPATEPCNTCQMCVETTDGRSLDVIEIDAASNRGIDEMRELRDKIKFAPTQARKKVFIIDEVHMLTKEAFNALLKTLEEPPAHAVFILATTEIHKVPVTISSRCQTFVFKKASLADLTERLTAVAAAETIAIEPAAAAFLARLAAGSYRDGLSLLDQVASFSSEPLTVAVIQNLLGLASEERLAALLEVVAAGQAETALAQLQRLEADGIDPEQFAIQLIDAARMLLHIRLAATDATAIAQEPERWQALAEHWQTSQLLELIRDLLASRQLMKQAALPLLPLEVVIIKAARQFGGQSSDKPPAVDRGSSAGPVIDSQPVARSASPTEPAAAKPVEASATDRPASAAEATQTWQNLLERVRAEHLSIHALLQQAELDRIDNGKLVIRVPFQFAAERLTDAKHRKIIEQALADILGEPLALECVVHSLHHTHDQLAVPDGALDPEVVDAAIQMFGSDEPAPA